MWKPKQIVNKPEKFCNICGEYQKIYQVIDNAPICEDCVPNPKKLLNQKIPNESTMVQRILGEEKNET